MNEVVWSPCHADVRWMCDVLFMAHASWVASHSKCEVTWFDENLTMPEALDESQLGMSLFVNGPGLEVQPGALDLAWRSCRFMALLTAFDA